MKNELDSYLTAYQGNNIYDFDNEILLTWYPKRIIKHSAGSGSLLELGIGHGYTTTIFSELFSRHLVLDGSSAVIDNFRKKHSECKAEIKETYFEHFDTDEKFDVIVMGFILEHVDNPIEILKKYKAFLNPNGKMFLAVPNAEVMNRKLGHLAGLLPDMTLLSENDQMLGHKRYYSVSSFTQDITAAGYKVNRMEGIYLKPFTTSQMLSLQLDHKVLDALCELGIDYPELCCGMLAEVSLR